MKPSTLARIISIVFSQYIWLPSLTVIFTLKSGLSDWQIVRLLPTLLFIQALAPVGFLELGRQLGKISRWDATKREERPTLLLVASALYLISLLPIYFWSNKLLLDLVILMTGLIFVFGMISTKWKISLHTGINTFGVLIINFLFDWQLPILFLIPPVVFWARFILKKHTIAQLLAGIVVSAVLALLFLRQFNYI